MSQKIDPREVLTYLNELGYTNINAQQLKDFISDLKKLIKYENRRRQKENIETITPANPIKPNYCHCPYVQTQINSKQINPVCNMKSYEKHCCDHPLCPQNQTNTSRDKEEPDDIFSHLYSQHTVASKAKETPRRERHISVHIKKPKGKTEVHEHCTHIEKRIGKPQESDLEVIQNIETRSDGSKLYVNTESTIRSVDTGSKQSGTTKTSVAKKKSKCSFIRSNSVKSINKSDPVALYHYYEQQWKKQKFPGQEQHSDLRWSVREKMLGGPKVEIHPSATTFRKRCNSWKG